jgi:hypothetical protein
MGQLTDAQMAEVRAKLAARRKARGKRTFIDPLQAEIMANLTHYEVHVFVDREGTRCHSRHNTLEEAQTVRNALGSTARALIYAAGRLPSRGPEAAGVYPVGGGEY